MGDEDVASAMPIVGSNTVLLGTIRHDVKNPISDTGRYLGLQIPAEGDPEVIWSEDVRPALTQAEPGSPYVRGSDTFIKEDGGSIVSAVRPDIKHPRLNRPDPETGAFDSGFVLQRDPEGGLPAWAESLGKDDLLPLADGMLASSGAGGFSGYANLTFYDYGTNKIRWSYDAKLKSRISNQQAEPVGVSSDGKYVYAMVTADLDSQLVELDAETGKKVRSWTFPDKVDRYLDSAEVYVHDDVMIWLSRFDSPVTKMYAAVFRLSE